MDWTPIIHAAIALAVQVGLGLTLGNWWLGAAMACAWFAAREHTQAEYRWIKERGAGKRANMPWWGGFDWRVWNWPSLLDCAAPPLACVLAYLAATGRLF